MRYYDKLVRDKIPAILHAKGKDYIVYRTNPDEHFSYLKKKLVEETTEFMKSPSLEELADIYEVLSFILKEMDFTMADVRRERARKINDRGAFDKKWILGEVSND